MNRELLIDAVYNCEEYSDICSERDYIDDAIRMITILKEEGINDIAQRDVMCIWYAYSNSKDASWIILPDSPSDKKYFIQACQDFIKKYSTVVGYETPK